VAPEVVCAQRNDADIAAAKTICRMFFFMGSSSLFLFFAWASRTLEAIGHFLNGLRDSPVYIRRQASSSVCDRQR
jgi:hypothetical protein